MITLIFKFYISSVHLQQTCVTLKITTVFRYIHYAFQYIPVYCQTNGCTHDTCYYTCLYNIRHISMPSIQLRQQNIPAFNV